MAASQQPTLDNSPHSIELRRAVLEWRDKHTVLATLTLNRRWQDLKPAIETKLEQVPWKSAIAAPTKYIKNEIDPLLAAELAPLAAKLVKDAHDDLSSVIEQQIEVDPAMADRSTDEHHLETAVDLLESLVPLAGGLAMGAALPSMAVVSGTAAFGLVATSTVSVPILAGGLAIAGLAVATGAVKANQLYALRSSRMKARVASHVEQALLSVDMNAAHPSVLARIVGAYEDAAAIALQQRQ